MNGQLDNKDAIGDYNQISRFNQFKKSEDLLKSACVWKLKWQSINTLLPI